MRDVRQGTVAPTANLLYMFFCVLFEGLKGLFTQTYSFGYTMKIIGIMAIVYIVVVGTALLVSTVIH
jgi:hypothetical protein